MRNFNLSIPFNTNISFYLHSNPSSPETLLLLHSLPSLKLSSFSVAVCDPLPALSSPLPPIASILRLVSMLRWVRQIHPHQTLTAAWHVAFSPASLFFLLHHTQTHTSSRGTWETQMDVSGCGAGSCDLFMKIHGAISPRTEVAVLTVRALKSPGSSVHRRCCFQWFVMCLVCN